MIPATVLAQITFGIVGKYFDDYRPNLLTICDVIWENPSHVAKGSTEKIEEINIIILMFFFIFYNL